MISKLATCAAASMTLLACGRIGFDSISDGGAGGGDGSDGLGIDMTGNVLLLHMEEPAWTGAVHEVRDSSGAGHHGTSFGDAAANAIGISGRGGAFQGGGIELPSSTDFAGAIGTFTAWIRTSRQQEAMFDERVIFVRGDHGERPDNGMILQLSGAEGGSVHFTNIGSTGGNDGNGTLNSSCGTRVDDLLWHHVVLVFDRTDGGTNALYVDGQPCGTGQSQPDLNWSGALDIGVFPGVNTNVGYDGPFAGNLDEITLWSRALSAAEVATLYSVR